MNLALNPDWQLNDTITYSVTTSQTCQSVNQSAKYPVNDSLRLKRNAESSNNSLQCASRDSINNLTTPCPILNVHDTCTLQYRFTLGTAAMLSTLVHFYIVMNLCGGVVKVLIQLV